MVTSNKKWRLLLCVLLMFLTVAVLVIRHHWAAPITVAPSANRLKAVVLAIHDAVADDLELDNFTSPNVTQIDQWWERQHSIDSWRARCLHYLEPYGSASSRVNKTPRAFSTVSTGGLDGITNIVAVVNADGSLARVKCNGWEESAPIIIEIVDSTIPWRGTDDVLLADFLSIVAGRSKAMREDVRILGACRRRFIVVARLTDCVVENVEQGSRVQIE